MLSISFHFVTLISVFAAFFVSGRIILRYASLLGKAFYHQLFFSSLCGIFLFTCITAFYFTHFKSILSLLCIFLLLLFFLNKLTKKEESKNVLSIDFNFEFLKNSPSLLLVLLFLFSWFSQLILNSNWEVVPPANPENSLYAQFAKIISSTGVENTFGIGFLPNEFPQSLSPYHYFDLWFTAGIGNLFNLTPLETIHFFTLPLFNFIAVVGICALFEKLHPARFYYPFLSLLLLFLSACYFFPFANKFGDYEFDYTETTVSLYGEKLSFALVWLIAVTHLYLSNQKTNSIILLLLIGLLYPTYILPVTIGILIFCCFAFWKKLISKKALLKILLFQLICMLAIIVFYNFFTTDTISLLKASDYKGFNLVSFKMIVAEFFYRAWNKPLRSLLIYMPYILILFISARKIKLNKEFISFLILVLCIYLAALISWASFYKLPEAWQLYTNTFILLHLLIIVLLFELVFVPSLTPQLAFFRISVLALLFSSIYFSFNNFSEAQKKYSYSEKFLTKIKSLHLSEEKNFLVAYILSPKDYNYRMELHTGGLTGSYLQCEKKFYGMVNIGLYEYLNDSSTAAAFEKVFRKQNFFCFVEKEKKGKIFKNIVQSQLSFLVKNHINYVVLSKNASLPALLKEHLTSSIEDSLTGEKFLVLDNSLTFK